MKYGVLFCFLFMWSCSKESPDLSTENSTVPAENTPIIAPSQSNNSNNSSSEDSSQTTPNAPLYLATNGITVKAGTNTKAGDRISFNGNVYLVVNDSILRDVVENDREILTYLVTSYVTDMSYLFEGRETLTPNIGGWDTSQVKNMSHMFYGAQVYNGDINNWDTSQVTDMSYMFAQAKEYNRYLGNWNTESVSKMEGMFNMASNYEQNLSTWCVPLILTQPAKFATLSSIPNQFLPSWGSCPD